MSVPDRIAAEGAGVVLGWLTAQPDWVTADEIARGTGQPAAAVRAALGTLEKAGRLEARRDKYGTLYRLTPRPAPPSSGVSVTVDAGDLEYLLAHYRDEVDGHPHRSHWQLPLLAATVARLQGALRELA